MHGILISLGLLGLGGLALFVRLLFLRRPSRVAVVVMCVALLIAVACVLLIQGLAGRALAG